MAIEKIYVAGARKNYEASLKLAHARGVILLAAGQKNISVREYDANTIKKTFAGYGKTRVLTTRLIHIIDKKKAWPNKILCVTFEKYFV